MKIKNHRLFLDDDRPADFLLSPNRRTDRLDPRFLIIHYTAGASFGSSVAWFQNPIAKASAHVVIGRDGQITQMVAFNQIAWHAGTSAWNGLSGINDFGIGIELDNSGSLDQRGQHWFTWFNELIPVEEVLVATHKNEIVERGWHVFPTQQLEALVEVAATIIDKYEISEVLGHDDISPHRKIDPGPAFPMASFRSKVLGRADGSAAILQTTADLNIRVGPGTQYEKLPEGPLPQGTRVDVLRTLGSWRFVDVLDAIHGASGLQGWVHGGFLRLE